MAAGSHVSPRLIRVVEAACRSSCASVCSVTGAVEMVLAYIHPSILGVLNKLCLASDSQGTGSTAECVDGLVNYVCSDAVQRCIAFTAARGEAMSECLTRATGTFGDMHEPWTEHNSTVLWILIFVLAVAVFWHSAISTMFSPTSH